MKAILVQRGALILVTGVTGYIGGSLVPRLLAQGYRVRVLAREPARLDGRSWRDQVDVMSGDLLSPATLERAMQGVAAAYYLVHNMSSGRDYTHKELVSARNFAEAASACGVEHIIYLGGLANPAQPIGAHMRSRLQTGDTLRQGRVPVTEFRASLVIGSGSISFELIRYLAEQLPVLVGPGWMHNRTQPIAIRDVLDYLLAALQTPASRSRIYEIGGQDVLTYAGTLSVYARVRGLMRISLRVPGLPVPLLARAAGLLSPVPARIAAPLLDGMRTDSVVQNPAAGRDFPDIHPVGYEEALIRALAQLLPQNLELGWEKAINSFRIRREGFFVEGQGLPVNAPLAVAWQVLLQLGGRRGWLYWNWLWNLRGGLDRLAGGPGMRGRRAEDALYPGDVLDFYRVEVLEPERLLRLRAELKAPGLGWMEWRLFPRPEGGIFLHQRVYFAPHGLPGVLYWYLLLPIHRLVFTRLLRAIARRATYPK